MTAVEPLSETETPLSADFHDPRHGYYFEDLKEGMQAVHSKTIGEADILMFAGVSGDTNPLHLDAEFAQDQHFGERIAHGMLSASLISTVIGTRLPGPGCIYVSQNLKFKAPVKIGDTVLARVEVTRLTTETRRARLKTTCLVGDVVVIEGDATVLVPSRKRQLNDE